MGQLRKINNNTSGRLKKISNNTQNSNINFVPTGNPTLKQSGNLSQGGGSLLYSESGSGSLFKKKKDNISTLDSVLTTIGDAALESTQATLGLVENLVSDPLTRLTGAVVGIFNKDLSKQIKDYADNDIVGSMFGKSDDLNIGLISKESRKMIDEYSLLGDVGDAVSQGVGTSLGLGAAGSVISGVESGVIGSAATSKGVQAANTFATSGISSYNSKLSEMHKAGYDEHNSQIAALKEGIFEGITENIGAGIPGLNTSGAFESLETSLGNAITKSLNKTAGKIAVNVLKAGEESSEEFFNNLFNEVSDRILYQIDKNYTYGKNEKSDSLIKDIFNEKTLEAMVSAGISSALTMGGSNVFDKVSTNKAIKSYAKDNNISFKEARDTINKYKQTISENLQRNGEESIVEANQQASALALRSAKDGSIAYNENRLKNLLKVTNDTEENIRKDLVSGRYDRYTFKKGTNANENALEMSFRDAGADNSQRTKDLVDLGKSIQNATKNKVQVRATNREQLLQNNNVLNSINKDIRISQQELIKEEQQEINRINNEYEAQLNSIDSTGMLDETLEASIRLEQQEKIQNVRQEYTRRLSEVKDKIQNEFLNNLNGFMTKDENGNAVLVVNYDSTNTESGKFIIGHELTHTLENVEGYEEYKKLINDYYQKNNSEEYNNHKKQLEKLYANNKGNIEAEMTADLTGKMFSDEKFLTNMLNTKANMFTNIYSKVKELYYKATGQQEKAQLEEIMRNFRNVYAKVKNADIDKEVKLSLSEDNGIQTINDYIKSNNYTFNKNGVLTVNNLTDKQIKDLVKIYHTTGYEDVSTDYLVDSLKKGNMPLQREVADRFIEKELGYKPTIDTTQVFEDAEGNPLTKEQVEFYKDSAVRDIRGRLIPVYHRTNAEFTEFDNKAGTQHGKKYGKGFYFSTTPENYGNITMKLYLNAKEGEFKYVPKMGYYIVQNPNQIKNIDNKAPTSSNDIRFSLSTKDNQGRELTKEQQEFFKDSKVRDDEGNLKVMYHGTPDTNFTIFENNRANSGAGLKGLTNKGFYFTDTKQGAEQYAIPRGERGIGEAPGVKEVYLNMTNPLVVDSVSKEGIKQIKDFFGIKGNKKITFNNIDNYVNKMLYDDAYNLRSEEQRQAYFNSTGYDGVILKGQYGDEYVVFNSNQIKDVNNINPTDNPDIRYSLSTKDNQGNEVAPGMQKYMSDSRARVDEDINKPLVKVYHTTTNEGQQFNEFNPVGTEYYRFGNQVVNYYTNSKEMSGSYADQNYIMADTKKITTMKEVKDYIKTLNILGWGSHYNYELVEEDGKYKLVDNSMLPNRDKTRRQLYDEANEFKKTLTEKELNQFKDMFEHSWDFTSDGRYNIDSYLMNRKYEFGSEEDMIAQKYLDIDNKPAEEAGIYWDAIMRGAKYHTVKTFDSKEDLFRNIKSLGSASAKRQYEGYVNITNPYIVDAEKRNWNQVISKSNDFIDQLDETLSDETKNNLTRLYRESENKSAELRDEFNVLENAIRGMWNSAVEDDIKKVSEVVKKVGYNEIEEVLNDTPTGIMGVNGWYNLADALKEQGIVGDSTSKLIIDDFKLPDYLKEYIKENYNKEIPTQQLWANNASKLFNQLGMKTTLKDLYNTNQQKYLEFDKYRMPENYFIEKISSDEDYVDLGELNDILETRAEIMGADVVANEIARAASVGFSKPEMIRLWGTSKTTNDIVKEVIASNQDGTTNYDGVIIKNVYDYGGKSETKKTANNLYITFNSNQFKAVDNENPTDDPDIRYSMSEEQETTPNEDAIRNQIVKEMPELPFVEDTDKGIENNNITPYTNSKGGILSDEDIKTRANELINEKINRNTLRTNERALEEAKISLNLDKQKVDEFNNSLNQYRGMTSEQLSQSKARDDIYDFVQKNSTMTYKENFEDETLKKAKNELRKTKIKITDELKNSITDYNEFKKSVFGKLTLSNEGQGVDSVYNEFKEMYPSYFEELNTEEDMLYKLKDFMESNTNTINEETYELTPNEIKSFADRIYYALQRGRLSESELNKYVSEINSKMENVYNRRLAINKYREDAKQYTKNLDLIKDKKMGILYQINTAKRNIRDIMPKDMAEEWYNHYIKPVSDNNAKANITHQYYNDRIAKYNLNDEESTYVQMIGEKGHNPQTTLTDNQIIDFYNKNQNKIDKAKCEKAVEEFRSIYDELYNSINQVLRANGYKGLEYRKGYFPHFIEEKSTSFLGKLAEKMGWKKPSGALPTDIAGITEEFKPGKAWTSFAQQRTGDATDYNALKGFDNYLNGAMDVIFHTEDIQKLRALENEIRYQYSDKGVKEKIDSIMNDDSLDIEEKYEQIQSTLSNVRNNPLGNLVSEIREYTNNLANKKSFTDRSMEQLFGRNTYSISKQIMSRVSANMVGANVSSAMTNFIPITQAWGGMSTKNLFKGIQSTIQATFKDDGFSNNSVWLTNRTKQADRLYKSKLDKINEKLGIPFEAVDSFTSNVIVRGKYLDNIEKGMSEQEAISNADEFAKDVMAGRSKGETPTAFNKTNPLLKMFTAFQLEVNNQYGYMFKDLPASAGEAKDKLAAALLKVFLGAFLYNWLSEKITGRKSAFSPIDTAIDNIETATNENLDFGQKLQAITKDVSQELPFVSGIVGGGRLPISSAIPFANRSEYQDSALELMVEAFGEDEAKKSKAQKELLKEFSKPIYFLALPFAGGQIKKTIEGAEMYSHELPGSYTTSGNLRFEAPQDTLGKAQALVFGQYASENAREYFDKGYSALTPKQVQEAQNADLSINEYREYQKGIKGKTKISEQVDYINSLPYSEEQKESLIKDKTKKDIDVSNYNNYDSYDEFNYAMNNPAKYDIIKQIVDYRTYNTYNDDIKKIKANSNNAKKEVINYIEKLNLNKYQKTMLYRISGGYSIKNYKDEMYNYINSLNITANEKKNIWKELYGG